jgi:hypothetical protein
MESALRRCSLSRRSIAMLSLWTSVASIIGD